MTNHNRPGRGIHALIPAGSPFDEIRKTTPEGREFWSARDLMLPLGYSVWRDFANAIGRAKTAARNTGYEVTSHFAGARKITGTKPAEDYHLSRFACYLIALNGDPRKPEIAAAQSYFVIKTREAETAAPTAPALPDRRELARMVIEAEDRADAEKARADALEGPAQAWEHLASARGDYAVADAAKILSRDPDITIGRDRLFRFMAYSRWVYRGNRQTWRAYQHQVDCGRLVERIRQPFYNERTGDLLQPDPTIRVTAKGLADLRELLTASRLEIEAVQP